MDVNTAKAAEPAYTGSSRIVNGRTRAANDSNASSGGTPRETRGVIVEGFGAESGQPLDVGDRIVAAARRWAVVLADDSLVFVDDADVAPV
jgi:hypothetical protein